MGLRGQILVIFEDGVHSMFLHVANTRECAYGSILFPQPSLSSKFKQMYFFEYQCFVKNLQNFKDSLFFLLLPDFKT